MAQCPLCESEMLGGTSCRPDPLRIGRRLFEPIPWGSETGPQKRDLGDPKRPCRDCAVPPGGIHHHGCAMERCPSCRGQAIMCDCDERWESDVDCAPGRSRSRCSRSRRPKV
jgi:hypothetical protein